MARKKKEIELPQITQEELIQQKAIGEIARDAFLDFGNYINNQRHTAFIQDGCKPSYRRLIYSALQFPKGKMIPSTTVISSVANYHPHSLSGIEELNANLVHTGVFEGHGSWGYTEINGVYNQYAAPRYTKQMVSDVYNRVLGELWKEVPMVESPVGPMEISYLPLPIPLCLYMKTSVTGLCIGVKNDYPNFSPKSLYQAYINNNPLLLEPNANLIIDKENSELDRLWKTGKGRVIYSYKLTRVTDDFGNPGILFEGDTFLFTPNFKKFKKLVEEGKVYMEDLTDINGPKMVISKVPGARGISIEEIEDLARKCCYSATNYTTNVTTGSTMFRIGLYDWLDYTYKNYIDLIVKVNQKKIEKTTFDIAVLEAIPLISDYILNKNPKATDEEIMKVFGMPQEIVSSVMSKPISYLRKNKDTSDRIKELKTRLKELKKFDPVAYTEQIINQL